MSPSPRLQYGFLTPKGKRNARDFGANKHYHPPMFGIRKFDLLVALYIFCIVTSELLGAKTVPLADFGWIRFNMSVAILTVPLVFTINDIITEVHGKERTRSVIRAGLVIVALTFAFAGLATWLPASPRFAAMEPHYDAVFTQSMRMSFASLMAFAIAEFTDLFIFVNIRKAMHGKALWLRNNASNFAAQFLDTVIFMALAFWAFDQSAGANVAFLTSLIIPYWLVKCAMSVLETPFVYWGVRWLEKE